MNRGKTLDVFYKGKIVGTLAITGDNRVAFQYSDDWLRDGFAISPFSLPLKNEIFVPEPESRRIFRGLFGVFADSLPDSWGELLLDRVLASKGIKVDDISILDRLAYVGSSGMGAFEYYPSRNIDYSISGFDYDLIAKECEKLLSSKTSDKLDILYKLAGSSGGTRPKILIKEGNSEWIVKFPASVDYIESGKREYDYSLCAKKCGIRMTKTELVPSKICSGFFKTERFDRENGEKIMCVSFSGLLEVDYRSPSCDYTTYMKLVNVLTRENKDEIEQMFRLMCFNVFAHNHDDHTKNFSFLRKNERWELAPAYDLTYSETYFGEHTTSVNGKGKGISDNDLIFVGKEAGLAKAKCKAIISEIKENIKELEDYLYRKPKEKFGKVGR